MAEHLNERARTRVRTGIGGAPGRWGSEDASGRPETRRRFGGARLTLVVGAALALSACAGSSTAAVSFTTEVPEATVMTTTAVMPPTTVPSVEDEVAAKYRDFHEALLISASPPDPDSPVLAQSMTGAVLQHVRLDTQNLLETGMAIRLPVPTQTAILDVEVRVDGGRAEVTGCVVDDAIIYARVGGRVFNDRVSSGRVEAAAQLTSDGWRISENRFVTKVEGPSECV